LTNYLNGRISIRIGSGMRMKILDSIHASSPVITTSKGCEGLPFCDGIDYLVANTASDFATSIEALLKDDNLQESLTKNAQNRAHSIMSNRGLTERRIALYECASNKE